MFMFLMVASTFTKAQEAAGEMSYSVGFIVVGALLSVVIGMALIAGGFDSLHHSLTARSQRKTARRLYSTKGK